MQNNITYCRKNKDVEYIYYRYATQSYPMHTHACHVTLGWVLDGEVCIICNGRKQIYHAYDCFCIIPDTPHTIESVKGSAYSMLCICINAGLITDEAEDGTAYIRKLKSLIMEEPEKSIMIRDMARYVGMSPYYMIRRFRMECGITPHQFQIQCRVRKAQKILEEGKSVIEAAYATGFCDQSHFDRCFHKFVRLTPSEYVQSVKRIV